MNKNISGVVQRLPKPVDPPIVTPKPNEGHVLYDGLMTVVLDGTRHRVRGTISQEWLPDPRVRYSGLVQGSQTFSLGSGEGALEVAKHLPSTPVLLKRADYNRGKEIWISGFLNGKAHWNEPSTGQVPSLSFALTNFHSYLGGPVRRNGGFSSDRLAFKAQGWAVTVDAVQNWRDLKKQLDGTGGFAVSHGGRIEKESGDINLNEIEDIQSALTFFFAFLRGFWCGPLWMSGSGKNSGYVRLLPPLLLSRWQNVRSWFPHQPAPDLSESFNGFLKLWNNADWNEPLRHAIWWYLEANSANSQESSIVMTQTALELLGWVVLVEQQETLSDYGFDNLPAADKIRLLLGQFDIPVSLDGTPALKSFSSGFNGKDGPGAFTLMRNAVVHPKKKKRSQLAQANREAKWEARQLGLKYLELVLLAMFGYEGAYRDRTDLQRMPRKPVPWAT